MGADRATETARARIAKTSKVNSIGFHECFGTYANGFEIRCAATGSKDLSAVPSVAATANVPKSCGDTAGASVQNSRDGDIL
jgi:hypothetical protein